MKKVTVVLAFVLLLWFVKTQAKKFWNLYGFNVTANVLTVALVLPIGGSIIFMAGVVGLIYGTIQLCFPVVKDSLKWSIALVLLINAIMFKIFKKWFRLALDYSKIMREGEGRKLFSKVCDTWITAFDKYNQCLLKIKQNDLYMFVPAIIKFPLEKLMKAFQVD